MEPRSAKQLKSRRKPLADVISLSVLRNYPLDWLWAMACHGGLVVAPGFLVTTMVWGLTTGH